MLLLWPSSVVGVHATGATAIVGVVHIRLAICSSDGVLARFVGWCTAVLLVVARSSIVVLIGAVVVFLVAVDVGLAVAAGSGA